MVRRLRSMPARRRELWQTDLGIVGVAENIGTNPLRENNPRNQGLCNLSIAVARSDDTLTPSAAKSSPRRSSARFRRRHRTGLRPGWKRNAESERLLGVDITRQMDCPCWLGQMPPGLRPASADCDRRERSHGSTAWHQPCSGKRPSSLWATALHCSIARQAYMAGTLVLCVRNARVSAFAGLLRSSRCEGA